MLTLKLKDKEIEFTFVDYFTKKIINTQSFSIDDSEQIANDLLKMVSIDRRKYMHKKIELKAAKALKKDAAKYHEKAKHEHGMKKKHEKIEEKEAKSAAKMLMKKAKNAHEY